jgi:hypothetical protein
MRGGAGLIPSRPTDPPEEMDTTGRRAMSVGRNRTERRPIETTSIMRDALGTGARTVDDGSGDRPLPPE